ncbi:MAG TPA: MFS transporter [Terriglobia bacterium]|nr:MFS transporter [Terriglobia bacterium]
MGRDFRYLLTAFCASNLGSKVAREALQMTAVITLQAGPGQLSLLSVAATAPVLLLGLFAGAWIERRQRRALMIAADLLRFAALISLPLAAWMGWLTIGQMIVVAVLMSILSLSFDVADQSLLPQLVTPGALLRANTRREQIDATTEIVGPPIGGWLVQVITAPATLVVDAVSYLLSAVLLLRIRHEEGAQTAMPRSPRQIWREAREGLRVLWRQPILRPLLIARSLRTFFGAMFGAYYIFYLINRLGVSPAVLGLIVATGGIASLFGTLLIRWTAAWLPVGPGIILAFAIKTLSLALLPLAGLLPHWALPLLIGQQLLQDGVTSYFAVHERHLRQRLMPPEQLARATAAVRVANDGPVPLGALLGGLLLPLLGLDGVLWFAVAGYSLSAVVAFFSPLRRLAAI